MILVLIKHQAIKLFCPYKTDVCLVEHVQFGSAATENVVPNQQGIFLLSVV